MLSRIMTSALVAVCFAMSAAAAPSSTSSPSSAPAIDQSGGTTNAANANASNMSGKAQNIAAKLHQSLTKAGFSDIQVMPESFLVRAKDSDGNPVMMVVNPDSITAVTAMDTGKNASASDHSKSADATKSGSSASTH